MNHESKNSLKKIDMIFQEKLLEAFKKFSDRTAILSDNETISFGQLLLAANRITSALLGKNKLPETYIGIVLKDRVKIIYSIIGVSNARCVFVPIDPELPINRINSIMDELDLKHIITSKSIEKISKLNREFTSILYVEELFSDATPKKEILPEYPTFDAKDSLYVYFTSGSTGVPRGIIGKNESLSNFVQWELEAFNINGPYKCSQLISPYFDAFLRDVFIPFLSGGTLCIPPQEEDFFTPDKITSWLNETGINLIHCVPSVFSLMNHNEISSEDFKELELILMSGEKIIPSRLKKWYDIFDSRIQLVNFYGTTEATMISTSYAIQKEDIKRDRIPIGSPIYNTELRILDSQGNLCRDLLPGDLHIVSEYMTKGYINNGLLNKTKFIKINGKRAFKTGDIARKLTNGDFELLGRADRQVKLNGMRVELDEVEIAIVGHSKISDVAVLVRKSTGENTTNNTDIIADHMVAFVVPEKDFLEKNNIEDFLRDYLKKNLPSYMIPSEVHHLEKFPVLENGKIDYNELLQIKESRLSELIEPENKLEVELLEIWNDILGEGSISVTASFHSLGGNSLAIMRLIGKVYKKFNIRLSLDELFNNFTIRKQASLILRSQKDSVFVINKAPLKIGYAMSTAQERLYFEFKVNPTTTAYNMPMAWEIQGAFDQQRIEESVNLLLKRHASLRTGFEYRDSKIVQIIHDHRTIKPVIINVEKNIEDAINDFIRPFDLTDPSLIRYAIFNGFEGKKTLIIDIHHIVCDGISQVNLYSDFLKLYGGGELQPLDIEYTDYVEWEKEFRTSQEYIGHREFWMNAFDQNIPTLQLPLKTSVLSTLSDEGGNVLFSIDSKAIGPMNEIVREHEISLFSTLYSLFFIYLCQLTGEDDLILGTNSSGRFQEELTGVVGMFVKTLPIRYRLDVDKTFVEFAKELHSYLVEAQTHQIFDLMDITKVLDANGFKEGTKNLIEVMFVFQNYDHVNVKDADTTFKPLEFENKSFKYPLSLFAAEGKDSIDFRFEYSTAYFAKSDVEILIKRFKNLIDKVSQNKNRKIIDFIGDNPAAEPSKKETISFNFK